MDHQLTFDQFIEGFESYHVSNPQIYIAFKKLTFQLISSGRKHYGAKAIFEVIRFNTAIKGNDQYKVNNNYTAYYARLFMKDFPKHDGFFNLRKSKFDENKIKNNDKETRR